MNNKCLADLEPQKGPNLGKNNMYVGQMEHVD